MVFGGGFWGEEFEISYFAWKRTDQRRFSLERLDSTLFLIVFDDLVATVQKSYELNDSFQ